MKPEDIYKVIEQAVERTVPPTVEKVVNGKINRLQSALDEHREESQYRHAEITSYLDELRPVADALRFLNYGRRFVAWVTPLIPLFLFMGGVYVAIRKIIE